MNSGGFIEPTEETGRLFFEAGLEGPVTMLNLLRFRDIADYSASPDLDPGEPMSGREAYDRYLEHTLPFLEEAGAEVTFLGAAGHHLIGPVEERWDMVMLVRHVDVETFLSFARNDAYLAGLGHRIAALEDSRLLPIAAPAR